MKTWPALLACPSIVLACQLALYALVTPMCGLQQEWPLHAVSASALLLTAVLTATAAAEWLRLRRGAEPTPDSDEGDRTGTRRLLAVAATAVGVLSCLAILAMWLPVAVLSPCLQ